MQSLKLKQFAICVTKNKFRYWYHMFSNISSYDPFVAYSGPQCVPTLPFHACAHAQARARAQQQPCSALHWQRCYSTSSLWLWVLLESNVYEFIPKLTDDSKRQETAANKSGIFIINNSQTLFNSIFKALKSLSNKVPLAVSWREKYTEKLKNCFFVLLLTPSWIY